MVCLHIPPNNSYHQIFPSPLPPFIVTDTHPSQWNSQSRWRTSRLRCATTCATPPARPSTSPLFPWRFRTLSNPSRNWHREPANVTLQAPPLPLLLLVLKAESTAKFSPKYDSLPRLLPVSPIYIYHSIFRFPNSPRLVVYSNPRNLSSSVNPKPSTWSTASNTSSTTASSSRYLLIAHPLYSFTNLPFLSSLLSSSFL